MPFLCRIALVGPSFRGLWVCRDARFGRPPTWKRASVYAVAEANAHVYWSGRTSRASLHKFERFVISGAVITNDLRFAFQSHPFCTVISPISPCNMAHFTAQYGWYGKPIWPFSLFCMRLFAGEVFFVYLCHTAEIPIETSNNRHMNKNFLMVMLALATQYSTERLCSVRPSSKWRRTSFFLKSGS